MELVNNLFERQLGLVAFHGRKFHDIILLERVHFTHSIKQPFEGGCGEVVSYSTIFVDVFDAVDVELLAKVAAHGRYGSLAE